MSIIIIKLFIALLCSFLFWLGGFSFLSARRFIMPFVLMIAAFWLTHSWICFSLTTAMGFLCLGYGDNSPLRHCFGNGWGRGVWGLLVAIALSLGLFLFGFISPIFFAFYLILNFTFENALKDINQKIGDPIIGFGFASLVFFL